MLAQIPSARPLKWPRHDPKAAVRSSDAAADGSLGRVLQDFGGASRAVTVLVDNPRPNKSEKILQGLSPLSSARTGRSVTCAQPGMLALLRALASQRQ